MGTKKLLVDLRSKQVVTVVTSRKSSMAANLSSTLRTTNQTARSVNQEHD